MRIASAWAVGRLAADLRRWFRLVISPLPTENVGAVRWQLDASRAARIVALCVFCVSAVYHVNSSPVINDHFDRISRGWQILNLGEVPHRDFFDPGYLLTLYSSAAALGVFGHNLLGELLLTSTFISAGFALAFLLAARASGSLPIAAVVTILAVATGPRPYNYDKVFFYILGLYLCWRYADDPTRTNIILLGGATGLAFLYRYDNAMYLTMATAGLLGTMYWRRAGRLVRSGGLYVAAGLTVVLPFAVFLFASGALANYFEQAIGYALKEGGRTGVFKTVPRLDRSVSLFALEEPLVVLEKRPRPLPEVGVRWRRSLDTDRRKKLEDRYGLQEIDEVGESRTRRYRLADSSQRNLAAMVHDPRVENTAGIDRGSFALAGEARISFWQRLRWSVFGGRPRFYPRFYPRFRSASTAVAWLYYLLWLLPIVALVTASVRRWRWRGDIASRDCSELPKITSAALLALSANAFILRAPLAARFGDVSAPAAVLAAWFISVWIGKRKVASGIDRSRWSRVATVSVIVVAFGMTWISVVTVSDVEAKITRSALLRGPITVARRTLEVVGTFSESPPSLRLLPSGRQEALVSYLRECTRPTDRILIGWFAPEIPFFAGRGFAGGMLLFLGDHWSSSDDIEFILERLRQQSVPVVLLRAGDSLLRDRFLPVWQYLQRNYRVVASDDAHVILVDQRRVPSGVSSIRGLPCFR